MKEKCMLSTYILFIYQLIIWVVKELFDRPRCDGICDCDDRMLFLVVMKQSLRWPVIAIFLGCDGLIAIAHNETMTIVCYRKLV